MSKIEHSNYLKRELYDFMRSSDEIFDFIQAGSLDGVWYWNVEKPEDAWMSPRFKEVFGYRDDEVLNTFRWWQENILQEDLDITLENFSKHLADQRHPFDQIVRYRHKSGKVVWVRCRGIAIRNKDGKAIRVLGAHTDVTSLKEAEASLIESQKMEAIGNFSSGIAHDLNNTLSVVAMSAELLKMQVRQNLNPREENIQEIISACKKASEMTKKILAIGRKQILLKEVVDINQFVKDAMGIFRRIYSSEIEISLLLNAEYAECLIDIVHLEQVLLNLLLNAKDAMAQTFDKKLTIETTVTSINSDVNLEYDTLKTGQYLELRVSDNGTGIRSEILQRVFDPFFTTKKEDLGSGLGLSTSFGIIKQLGGTMYLSNNTSGGLTVSIYLPIVGSNSCI